MGDLNTFTVDSSDYVLSRRQLVKKVVDITGLPEAKVNANLIDLTAVGVLLRLPNRNGLLLVVGYDGRTGFFPQGLKKQKIVDNYLNKKYLE